MLIIIPKENENIESLLKRFKRKVMGENILVEVKKRKYYVKPSSEKYTRRKKKKRLIQKKLNKKRKLF
ncbi:MAG: 30S ribosomal protein S21 [Spirochaetes bacterium]|nr:30S ribosomal protein S21 [Spirochaetota bacterium]